MAKHNSKCETRSLFACKSMPKSNFEVRVPCSVMLFLARVRIW